MDDVTLQVSEAIHVINQTLDQAFPFILVEGEVASFKVNQNKFVFFDIKDQSGSLGCFMMVFHLKFPLEDGMKVRVLAQPKITQWGKFSLTVREVMPVGEGSLKKSFELLKAKLEKEGLFEQSRKRQLPDLPSRIGVVSSSQAAGYGDFLKVLENRWGGLEIILVDVPVQGIEAPAQIIGALEHLNELAEPVEVIALLRGGGSADDLSAFNHEDLVRAVASSRTPTIVGVGHEVDVSLADLAADQRAATPSNAAEILVPDKKDVLLRIQRLRDVAENSVQNVIATTKEGGLEIQTAITHTFDLLLQTMVEKMRLYKQTLHQLNPETILKRGYTLVRKNGKMLTKSSDVILHDEISIQFNDGEVGAKVINVQ